MRSPVGLIAGVIIAVFLVYLVMDATYNTNRPENIARTQVNIELTQRTAGSLIALIAAVALLLQALKGEKPTNALSLTIALFAGLLIVRVHWSLALALAALIIAMLMRGILKDRAAPAEKTASPATE